MPQWRKLHTKSTESQDINEMPDDFMRLLWVMLPLGLDREGRSLDNASFVKSKVMPLRLDVTLDMVEAALDWYASRDMIRRYEVRGRRYFYATNWAAYQGDTSREAESNFPPPPTGPEQEQVAPEEPAPAEAEPPDSRPTHESLMTNSGSDVYADSDADADADAMSGAPAPETPPPTKKPKRNDPRGDGRHSLPGIQAARSAAGRYPPRELWDDIISALGNAPDGRKLTECRKEWVSRGYNPNAWKWLLEWYRGGIPPRGNGARASPRSRQGGPPGSDNEIMPSGLTRLQERMNALAFGDMDDDEVEHGDVLGSGGARAPG